jgi:hypothetical protein
MHRGFIPTSFTHTYALFRRPSLSPRAPPRRSAAAACAHRRQPPTPPLTRDPVVEKHHCDPLQLTDPSNFAFLHPSSIFHSTGELKSPPPLDLAVDPPIQSLLAPAKHTVSTTSSRGSSSTTFLPPSGTLATGTPSTPLGAPPRARLRHRYAASAPPFPDTGHPRNRRESLSISPHLPLAAGELSHRNLIGNRSDLLCSPARDSIARIQKFPGAYL